MVEMYVLIIIYARILLILRLSNCIEFEFTLGVGNRYSKLFKITMGASAVTGR